MSEAIPMTRCIDTFSGRRVKNAITIGTTKQRKTRFLTNWSRHTNISKPMTYMAYPPIKKCIFLSGWLRSTMSMRMSMVSSTKPYLLKRSILVSFWVSGMALT